MREIAFIRVRFLTAFAICLQLWGCGGKSYDRTASPLPAPPNSATEIGGGRLVDLIDGARVSPNLQATTAVIVLKDRIGEDDANGLRLQHASIVVLMRDGRVIGSTSTMAAPPNLSGVARNIENSGT